MGSKLSPTGRLLTMRNPFTRAFVLAVCLMALVVVLLRSDADMRSAVVRSANKAKGKISQHPIFAGGKDEAGPRQNATHTMDCGYDMEQLRTIRKKYELDESFEYFKRYIKLSRDDSHKRSSMTKVKQDLLPSQFSIIDTTREYHPQECPEPLHVPVTLSPRPQTADLSDFMFGVSTTYKRFKDPKTSSIREWSYWLTDGRGSSNGGKLVLLLLDANNYELQDARKKLREAGIDADVYASDGSMEMAVRYLTLIPTLYQHSERKNKKWLVSCDDDTFFPSPNALVERMAEFDTSLPLYVGTLSEDVNNIQRHGSQAFGGAGVFISVPLAEQVARHYSSCKTEEAVKEANTGWGPQGDILLRNCIYKNTDVRLTALWDLWQLDLYNDPSGFYESGVKPLSLHHYRGGGGWHTAHPFEYTKIARLCGEDCTMQRFQTADDFVIANGFSVARYPRGVDFNAQQVERTFTPAPEDRGWNLDFRFGPQRKSLLQTGRKISWDLKEASVRGDGSVSQVYVRHKDDYRWKDEQGNAMSHFDGVIELIWIA
ncbi:uncharacterized protein E0L32_007452 [Thyridium curvatum]|uniref:Fringe-like glycosyltransferase domain-containing protein n=1 Tax=Thyridium curvatum TaxID=1093900 RepID=A0A507AZT3_9PEZI|nr:uncharacterized protein E0L32_007452 [Thyridium curvatum]TPX11954.1 hypothetical protein E0L32_007452 [Thyridium curvatum]